MKINQIIAETTGVTDYNPKSQGGTRKELLAKYHKTKDPKDAEAARKAGATQKELKGEDLEENGLWDNIHAKRERIKHGSGERMRKPGSKGAPTAKNFRDAANEDVNEASTIDGKVQDPKSNRWKQTSLSPKEAIAKYGKENVRVERGALRNGGDMVEVKVTLGEQRITEVNPHNFDSDEDYYDAVRNSRRQQFSGDWDVWDEIASLENQIKYSKSAALAHTLYQKIDQLKRDNGIEDEEGYYGDFDDEGNPIDEGDYEDGSSLKTPSTDEWTKQYQQAVQAIKNAKTQEEYEAASDRAGQIKDFLASKGIKVGGALGESLTPNEQFDIIEEMVESIAQQHGVDSEQIWEYFERVDDNKLFETAAWQRKAGKNKNGGLNAKGVASYRREHPGSKLQTAVTTKPSKLKKGSKAAKRRKSFCARMSGVKGPMKKPNGKPTRKALALRKWNC